MKPAILFSVCAAASAGVAFSASGAPAGTGTATQASTVSHRGVGEVKIGMRYSVAKSMGLVGPLNDGCELDGPNDGANLRPPLKGFVDVSTTSTPRIRRISVLGGATARGVGVGSPLTKVKAAFPKATVTPLPEFNVAVVRVPKSGGGKFDFLVRTRGQQRVRSIEVRRFSACE